MDMGGTNYTIVQAVPVDDKQPPRDHDRRRVDDSLKQIEAGDGSTSKRVS